MPCRAVPCHAVPCRAVPSLTLPPPLRPTAGVAPGGGSCRGRCVPLPGSGQLCPGAAAALGPGQAGAQAAWGRDGWGGEGEGKGEREEEGKGKGLPASTDRGEPALPCLPSPAAVTAGNNGDREAGGLSIGGGRETEGTCHPRPAALLPLPARSRPAPAAGTLRGQMLGFREGRGCAACLPAAGGNLRSWGRLQGPFHYKGRCCPGPLGPGWGLRVRSAGHGTVPLARAGSERCLSLFIELDFVTVPGLVGTHSFLISCVIWRTRTRGEKVWIFFAWQCVDFFFFFFFFFFLRKVFSGRSVVGSFAVL
nr:uncharacterized protein LOC121469345 [Taeniopygia guttata]